MGWLAGAAKTVAGAGKAVAGSKVVGTALKAYSAYNTISNIAQRGTMGGGYGGGYGQTGGGMQQDIQRLGDILKNKPEKRSPIEQVLLQGSQTQRSKYLTRNYPAINRRFI